jgi:hypothetical protein
MGAPNTYPRRGEGGWGPTDKSPPEAAKAAAGAEPDGKEVIATKLLQGAERSKSVRAKCGARASRLPQQTASPGGPGLISKNTLGVTTHLETHSDAQAEAARATARPGDETVGSRPDNWTHPNT